MKGTEYKKLITLWSIYKSNKVKAEHIEITILWRICIEYKKILQRKAQNIKNIKPYGVLAADVEDGDADGDGVG